MTTVAAKIKDGVGYIAADSRASDDEGFIQFSTPKLHRVGESVYGIAGDDWVDFFMEWVKSGFKKVPERIVELHHGDVSFNVLELSPTGLYLWNRTFTRMKLKDQTFAIGSGESVALYVMRYQEMMPANAVQAASLVDPYTGGEIDTAFVKQRIVRAPNNRVVRKPSRR